MKQSHRRNKLALGAALAMMGMGTAWAAEETAGTDASSEPVMLDTVEVAGQDVAASAVTENRDSYTTESMSSATRLDLSVRETPQSVSVVTRTQMDDFGLVSINEVLDSVTGVVVERVETDRTYYTARGFDITNFQVDGIGLPLTYGNVEGELDTAIYDRIEVVRGANGLMAGAGNPSATINQVRKRPTAEARSSVAGTVGSWDQRRIDADVSDVLTADGTVRGRIVAAKEDRESYLDRYALDKTVLYGVIEADLGEKTVATVGYSRQTSDADSPLWGALPLYYTDGTPTDYDVSTSTAADWAFWDSTDQRLFAEVKHELGGGWNTTAVVSHGKIDGDAELFYVYGTPDPVTELGLFSWPSSYELEEVTNQFDVSAVGPFRLAGREHQLVVGFSWARAEVEDHSIQGDTIGTALTGLDTWDGAYPRPNFVTDGGGSDWRDTQEAVYAAARFSLADKLALIAGGRLSNWKSDGDSYGVDQTTAHDGVLTPYAGIVYDLDDVYSVYASYAETFAPQTETDINRNRLDPVESINYEAGIKGEFYQGRLNTAVTVFKTYETNVAEPAGTIPGSVDTYYRGVDGVTGRGFELEVAGEITPHWQASAGYTRLKIEDRDGNEAKTYTPKGLFKLATSYRLPGIEQLKVGAGLRWQDDIYIDQGGGITTGQDAYALLDLMASYRINESWSATFNANNVTDEKYLTSLYWTQAYYGAPRSYALSVRWDFE